MKRWRFVFLASMLAGGAAASEPARILRPDKTAVSSYCLDYDATDRLADGVREPRGWEESWLSAENAASTNWVEMAFTSEVPVRTVAIFWGDTPAHPATSRAYSIQAWLNGAFTNILEVKDNPAAGRTVHVFEPVIAKRFRICQPPGGGSAARPNALWIAEIELYSTVKPDSEFGTSADLAEVLRLQHEVRDRTVGVYWRDRYLRGRGGALARPVMGSGWRVIQLERLDPQELSLCRAVALCGCRSIPNKDTLAEYVRNGGGLLVVHDACGRGPGSVIPDIWQYVKMAETGAFALTGARHPITQGITHAILPTYGDYAVLKAGPRGTALVRDTQGRDVAVAGRYGDGKAVAIGTYPGMSTGTNWSDCKMVAVKGGEAALLTNAVRWLMQDTKPRDPPWRKPFLMRGRKPAKTMFENVTEACGMRYAGYSKSVALGDVNGDGFLDIFASQCKIAGANPCYNLFYRNNGDWSFTEIGRQAGVQLPHGIGSAFADVNGDGKLDLFISWMTEMADTNSVSGLFFGDGKGGFRNVTHAAGLDGIGQVSICQWADIDKDGDVDLYVAGYEQENKIYRNRGDGTFEDATAVMGIGELTARGENHYGGNQSGAMADLDGDGYPDIVAYSKYELYVFRNDGGKRFVEVPEYRGPGKARLDGGQQGYSLGVAIGDYDNDGDLDLYVSGPNVLLRNDGGFRFADATPGSGLDTMERKSGAYGTAFEDWNNDGRLDLFLANGGFDSFAFENSGDGTFKDVSGVIGLDMLGAHGFNFGDLDNDGDLDFYATGWGRRPTALLRNNLDDGNALTIRVRGRASNTAGVGAKVWVYAEPARTNAARRLLGYREVRSGGGSMYTAGAILEQHVGMDPRRGPCTVEVLFPASGKRVTVDGVTAPEILAVEEP